MKLTPEQTAVRAAFLEKQAPQAIEVQYRGHLVEVCQPSLADRGEIMSAGGAADLDRSKWNLDRLQVRAIVLCTYFPGTKTRVFSHEDEPELKQSLVGGAIDRLATAALRLISIDEAKIEQVTARALRGLKSSRTAFKP